VNRIDWISFSIPVDHLEDANDRTAFHASFAALDDVHPDLSQWLFGTTNLQGGNGRAPYNASWSADGTFSRLYCHPALPHALVEVSGQGCARLSEHGTLRALLLAVADRLTRIDIATDLQTDTVPLDFVSQRREGRFKSHSEFVSESGTTCYVGSRTSNRYARVYRYNKPHERAHILRVEVCLKAQDAKIAAVTLLEDGLDGVAASLGEAFGWQHPDWLNAASNPVDLPAWRPERREGKTLYWLADTVAPLLRRLHKDSIINAEEWFDTHVRRSIIDSSDD
jgi:hypothetical protein